MNSERDWSGFDWSKVKVRQVGGKSKKKPDELFARSYRKHTTLLRNAKVTAAVWNVYDELVWRDFKAGGKPFKLSNHALGDLGISHDSKARALNKLNTSVSSKSKSGGRRLLRSST